MPLEGTLARAASDDVTEVRRPGWADGGDGVRAAGRWCSSVGTDVSVSVARAEPRSVSELCGRVRGRGAASDDRTAAAEEPGDDRGA